MKYLKKEELERLPKEVVEEVKRTLRAYSETSIVYENGKYKEQCLDMLCASYAEDFKVIGYVKQEDVYTLEERKKNFKEVFGYDMYC